MRSNRFGDAKETAGWNGVTHLTTRQEPKLAERTYRKLVPEIRQLSLTRYEKPVVVSTQTAYVVLSLLWSEVKPHLINQGEGEKHHELTQTTRIRWSVFIMMQNPKMMSDKDWIRNALKRRAQKLRVSATFSRGGDRSAESRLMCCGHVVSAAQRAS